MNQELPPMVVFDIGGVLARISHTWQEAAAVAGVAAQLPETPLKLDQIDGFASYQQGQCDEDSYLCAIGSSMGLDTAAALQVHNAILIEPYPGTDELIRDLTADGIRTGVLSNTNRPHWEILTDPARYPSIARIEWKMASHEVGLEKPDSRIFQLCSDNFGCRPEGTIYFDDSHENVASARSLGWRAHRIDPWKDPVAQMREILAIESILPSPKGR